MDEGIIAYILHESLMVTMAFNPLFTAIVPMLAWSVVTVDHWRYDGNNGNKVPNLDNTGKG